MRKQCHCGKFFTAKTKRAKYCSPACRKSKYRSRSVATSATETSPKDDQKQELRGQHVRATQGDEKPPSYKKTSPLVPLAIPNGFLQCINCGEIVSEWETYHFDGEDYCPDCRDDLELNTSELTIEGNDILIVNEAQDKIWFVDAPKWIIKAVQYPIEGQTLGPLSDKFGNALTIQGGHILSIETPNGHIVSVAIEPK